MAKTQAVFMSSLWVLVGVLAASAAGGAPVALVDSDPTSADAKYSIDKNANVAHTYNATDVPAQQGTLTFNTTWGSGDFATRSILFQQTAFPAGGFLAKEGLRLQIELSLGNNTGLQWDGFEIRLEDDSVPARVTPGGGGEGSHVFKAHFHANTGGIVVAGGLTTPAFNNVSRIDLSGGPANSLLVTNFFLHERNLKDADAGDQAVKRNFTMFLTPHAVPAPPTWALLVAPWLVVSIWRRARYTRR